MNRQQLQLPIYQQVAGAVQMPLLMLVWCALVLFFGYQYQANALLPSDGKLEYGAGFSSVLGADEFLRGQQRHDRLLAEIAAQAPAQLPELLDPQEFGSDLAAALATSELGHGHWQPGQQESAGMQVEHEPAITERAVSVLAPSIDMPDQQGQGNEQFNAQLHTNRKPISKPKAAKFVRLPAAVQSKVAMRVDTLRASKDSARADLNAGRPGVAYQRLRGKISRGRTDIEFLGLLALASLQQQPEEAEVIYHHLVQLQPDTKRWRQGLEHSQSLLAARSGVMSGSAVTSVVVLDNPRLAT